MRNIALVTLGILFTILGFFSLVILFPNLAKEFGGVIISVILILTGGGLVFSQIILL